jgi:hypothetical protein
MAHVYSHIKRSTILSRARIPKEYFQSRQSAASAATVLTHPVPLALWHVQLRLRGRTGIVRLGLAHCGISSKRSNRPRYNWEPEAPFVANFRFAPAATPCMPPDPTALLRLPASTDDTMALLAHGDDVAERSRRLPPSF